MFPSGALATISQAQVRAVNSRQPSSRSRADDCGGRLTRGRRVQAGEAGRADPETRRINGKRVPGPGGDDEDAGKRRAGELHRRHRHLAQGVCLLQPLRAYGHRREPGRCGVEERRPGPGEPLQHDQLPDARGMPEQQRRGRRLDSHTRDVGGEHHAASGQAAGEDAAGEQENDERGGLRGNHEAEAASGSRQVEHRPGEREQRDSIAEQRHHLPGEEQPKLALPKRAERIRRT
jgi:hypothetical protein